MAHKIRIAALYRGRLRDRRGTPIRIQSLLSRLAKNPDFALTIYSWDETPPLDVPHVRLFNHHRSESFAFVRRLRRDKVDIVLGHTMSSWPYLLLAQFLTPARVFLEMHGFLEEDARLYGDISIPRFYLEKCIYALFYFLCDFVTTCGEESTNAIQLFNKHVVTFYGGVDNHLFSPDAVPGNSVTRSSDDIVIGYAGNLRKWQGIDFLVPAFTKLRAIDPSFRLAILTSETKDLPQGDGIQIISGVPNNEVPSFLASCDILVIPRLVNRVTRLGPPSKLFEYMAMGKTVVASALGDMDVIIRDGVNGRTYPPGDEAAFIAVLRNLKGPQKRALLGQKAAQTARERFDWEREMVTFTSYIRALKHDR